MKHHYCLTFLNVSVSIGLPLGNVTKLGHNWLNLLIIKQIAADTTHWNHVTNNGASKLTWSLLNNALFTNTVTIDVILKDTIFKLWQITCLNFNVYVYTNMPQQRGLCECISTTNFQVEVGYTFFKTRCTWMA